MNILPLMMILYEPVYVRTVTAVNTSQSVAFALAFPSSTTSLSWHSNTLPLPSLCASDNCKHYNVHYTLYTYTKTYKYADTYKTQNTSTYCLTLCKWKLQILQLCIISQTSLDIPNRKLDLILVQVKITSTTILMCSCQLFLTFCQPS